MEDYRLKERSSNFTAEESSRLKMLVDKYKKILMCKKTDGISVKRKDNAWCCIAKEFNAAGQTPRTIKQLKYKFENMKRGAKRASKERQIMRRTGAGKPPSLPPASEVANDWLGSIMSGTIDGNEAIFDDDVTASSPILKAKLDNRTTIDEFEIENPIRKNISISLEIDKSGEKSTFDCSTLHSSLKRREMAQPLKRKLKKSNDNVEEALIEKKLSVLDELDNLELEKMKQTIRHSEEKHNLEIQKLQLEIEILKERKKKDIL